MEIYKSKSDQPLVDWQWYEPSLRNITHLILKNAPHPDGLALDVGCGTGRVTFALDQRGYRVHGLDIEERVVEIARRIAIERGSRATFNVGDYSKSDLLQPDTYDLVVCSEVLEHVNDYHPLIRNMFATLKPGGRIIITVPFDPRKWSVLDEYGGHIRRYTLDQIRRDLSDFHNIKFIVTGFPFYRLLVRTYLAKMRLTHAKHSNEELWNKSSTRIVARILYPFIRLDNLFTFTQLGDALIAVGDKRAE